MVFQQSKQEPCRNENWILEEDYFDPEYLAKYESIFAQGNGYLGQRAALDEHYWGQTRGLFVSGTFRPDATCTRGQIVTFLYRHLGK